MTPLPALEPYKAVAAASFNTEKDSISSGLILFNPVEIGKPSTTINGWLLLLIETAPRIRKAIPCPGIPVD